MKYITTIRKAFQGATEQKQNELGWCFPNCNFSARNFRSAQGNEVEAVLAVQTSGVNAAMDGKSR